MDSYFFICNIMKGFLFSFTVAVALAVTALAVTAHEVSHQQDCGTSRRRPWRDLSCDEQQEFLQAVQALKMNGIYDELVNVHWDSRRTAHDVPEFLPWHRWFLWVFEKELQRVSGTCMTVPYWDWERGDHQIVLKSWSFGTQNGGGCVEDGIARHWNPAEPKMKCLWRDFDDSWEITRDAEVLSRITNFHDFDRFARALESAPHSGVHQWIGGHMSDDWSPDDPLFWLHHSNVDRIWALWQDFRDHDEIDDPQFFYGKHFSGPHMDHPLTIFQGKQVDFNVPSKARPPTPRELLTNVGGIVDVQYVKDTLARMLLETSSSYRHGGNNPAWVSPATAKVHLRCRGDPFDEPDDESSEDALWNHEPLVMADTAADTSRDSTCFQAGQSCESMGDCCSRYCSQESKVCATLCYGTGSSCETNEECCSEMCSENGRCEGTFRRNVLETEVLIKDEPLEFSNPKLKARWYELIAEYPDNPAGIWKSLASEDCANRALAEPPGEESTKLAWINMMHERMGIEPQAFDCHYES